MVWSERGAVNCADHTPYEGSDTWNWEKWEPVPVEAVEEQRRDPRYAALRCETCGKEATR